MSSERVLVVSSCTSTKATLSDGAVVPAETLYEGEQHRRLMRGVQVFRSNASEHQLDLRILSAGHGLIEAGEPLAAYDETFAGMRAASVDARARELGVGDDLHSLLAAQYALCLLLLGGDYLRAAQLSNDSTLAGPTIAFCGEAGARRLQGTARLHCVPAGKAEARRYSCGLVGLKGEMAGRLLKVLADRPDLIDNLAVASTVDLLDLIDSNPAHQIELAA